MGRGPGWLVGIPVSIALLAPIPGPAAQSASPRPAPDTYHWLLPAEHSGVDVATLHPNDCYVVQDARGFVHFGEAPPDVREIQRQLGVPGAHLVEMREAHPECHLESCGNLPISEDALHRRLLDLVDPHALRGVGHVPTPFDDGMGGAYTDVGSDERARFRFKPEQRMLHLHLQTSQRGNCYQARALRLLSIHIRDQRDRPRRTGIYSGFLYVEHHHPAVPGGAIAWNPEEATHRLARSAEAFPFGLLIPRHAAVERTSR